MARLDRDRSELRRLERKLEILRRRLGNRTPVHPRAFRSRRFRNSRSAWTNRKRGSPRPRACGSSNKADRLRYPRRRPARREKPPSRTRPRSARSASLRSRRDTARRRSVPPPRNAGARLAASRSCRASPAILYSTHSTSLSKITCSGASFAACSRISSRYRSISRSPHRCEPAFVIAYDQRREFCEQRGPFVRHLLPAPQRTPKSSRSSTRRSRSAPRTRRRARLHSRNQSSLRATARRRHRRARSMRSMRRKRALRAARVRVKIRWTLRHRRVSGATPWHAKRLRPNAGPLPMSNPCLTLIIIDRTSGPRRSLENER